MSTIFVEVDVQVDFVDPKGALYVAGSDRILPNIRHLLELAGAHRVTTISPTCAHLENDPEFTQFAPHCIEGSAGARRQFDSLPNLPRRVWEAEAQVPAEEVRIVPGMHYVVKKRTFPMFANPWMAALRRADVLRDLDAVVFGVATDVCVRVDVLDLCRAGVRVRLVEDGIAGIDPRDSVHALEEMRSAGVQMVSAQSVLDAASLS
jgi:nicotinamidase/pyrazinamidase